MDGSYQKINEANPNYGGMDQTQTQGGYPGGPPPAQGGYPGGPPPAQGGYPGGPPPAQGGNPGGPPPAQGEYPGGPPPAQGGYPGGPPPAQGGYQGGPPPAQGGYQGGPPPAQGGYPGGPPPAQGGYPGGPPPAQGGYPGGPPPAQGGYPGGPPPAQGGYPGGPPPAQGGYPGGPPPAQGGYPGGPPPAQGGYPGGPPPAQGGYPGGPPPAQGGYPGGPPPAQGGYPGGPPPAQGGYPGGPPQNQYPQQPVQYPQNGQPANQVSHPLQQGYPVVPGPVQVSNTNAPPSAPIGHTKSGAPIMLPTQFKPPQFDGDHPTGQMPMQVRAPPAMNPIAGYEGAGFTAGDFFPPPTQFQSSVPSGPPQMRPEIPEIANWKEDDVRNALLDYIAGFRCYGKGAANDMEIKEILHTSAFHYKIETFTEGRQVNWEHEPYNLGMPIDGPEMGRPPPPWEIPVSTPELFKEESLKVEVPHTAYVKPCHTCCADGVIPCQECWGLGQRRCSWCHGDGVRHESTDPDLCNWCHGDGYRRCEKCDNRGAIICPDCEGEGNLKFFLELKIKWNNHLEDFIKEDTPLPDELIKEVSGVVAFEETNMRVWPLSHFPQPEINEASNNLVQKHSTNFPTERILHQRHSLQIVPVAEVKYEWKGDASNYFVYGEEKKVYAPNYPQTCCWGCTIL